MRRRRTPPACGRSSRSRRRRWRTASSSTSTSRGPTACVFGESVNEVRTRLGRHPRDARRPPPADVVVPVPDSGVCAAARLRRASRHPARSAASSATTTWAARSSSRSSRSGTSA
ncbi:MAG: hypothetical protein MZV64_04615 [Ignavibacteriales bacterium]|nr:hypothetical protein [Ignavibacteriales bacterium]